MVRRGKKEERKKGSIPMSDGCSMPSFLVVGCSIRDSLTCLFIIKKVERWRGTPYPPPLRCFARRFCNLNRSPTYCTIPAGRRILHTIISGRRMLYQSFFHAYLRKVSNATGGGHPIPYPPPGSMLRPSFRLKSRPLCPSTFIFRWIGPWMDVDSLFQISAPLGRRMLTSLTCLLKKCNDGRGTPYPPPLGCFARHSAILIGHQHTIPSLLVVGSSIP